jgi:thiol-disulfide isomerase/thioredoxin
MRKLIVLLSMLTLVGCGSPTTAIKGEILNCAGIEVVSNPSKEFPTQCLDGSAGVNVSAIKGPAIINVWGSWCDPCREELPFFVEFNEDKDERITLIGIDVEEKNAQAGRAFAIAEGMSWPNLFDADGSTRKYFGMGVPVTWFVDSNGRVVHKKIGPVKSAAELHQLANKYLGVS